MSRFRPIVANRLTSGRHRLVSGAAIQGDKEQRIVLCVPRGQAERISEFRRRNRKSRTGTRIGRRPELEEEESRLPSTRDPILLLEPSNLLEPLSFEDRHVGSVTRSILVDRDPVAPQRSTRAIR